MANAFKWESIVGIHKFLSLKGALNPQKMSITLRKSQFHLSF